MTRSRATIPPLCVSALVVGFLGCGGFDDSTGPEPRVPTSIVVANQTVTLSAEGETRQLEVTVLDQDGVAIVDASVFYSSTDPNVAVVSVDGLVSAVGNGTVTIEISAGQAAQALAVITVKIPTAVMLLETPVEGLAGGPLGERFFTLDVPEGDPDRVLQIRLQGGTGDADLAVRLGEPPDLTNFDCVSFAQPNVLDNLEFCSLLDPEPGTWHILVLGIGSFSGVDLDARLETATTLENAVAATDLSGDRNDLAYFQLAVPQPAPTLGSSRHGTRTTVRRVLSASRFLGDRSWKEPWGGGPQGAFPAEPAEARADGSLQIVTSGGTGDADLFATADAAFSFTSIAAMPCISGGETNDETCEVLDPEDGVWNIFLLGFGGFEGVSLTATFTPSALGGG